MSIDQTNVTDDRMAAACADAFKPLAQVAARMAAGVGPATAAHPDADAVRRLTAERDDCAAQLAAIAGLCDTQDGGGTVADCIARKVVRLHEDRRQAVAERDAYRAALLEIVNNQPCLDGGGGVFYPHYDGDGNPVGEQSVDPIAVIGGMVGAAQKGLAEGAAAPG